MVLAQVPLQFTPDYRWAVLRELNGTDEAVVSNTRIRGAIALIDCLLVNSPEGLAPGQAARLTAPDRDRVLASIYQGTFGSVIESTVRCRHCHTSFDVRFALPDLIQQLSPSSTIEAVEALPNGVFQLSDGCQFRLPTGEDECAVLGLSPDQAIARLLQRCVITASNSPEPVQLQKAMSEVAPLLDLDLDTVCPECSHFQSIHFDMQSYLLTALEQEQRRLMQEVHRMAIAYGWSLTEILGLSRRHRRELIALIEAEWATPRRRML
jgi:hypothetical protein